jgi:hypothetical protein
MPDDCRSKTLKMKWGNIKVRTSGDTTAVVWKDKCDVNMLTNIRDPPEEGNFCDESGKTLKPAVTEDNNRHTCYVDKSDKMVNSYSHISHCLRK